MNFSNHFISSTIQYSLKQLSDCRHGFLGLGHNVGAIFLIVNPADERCHAVILGPLILAKSFRTVTAANGSPILLALFPSCSNKF
ncbi:unnamed protein product [Cylindrotheca closterium]|uniref:Uncharacterized protein n=1 Tax=Cylindrotheca closterium TaxID=2856 RepID=A0AAD2GCX1_9STRA|nr:unnamed protein product [Cylindrotheca closterium]